ncbi:MAG: glycosyltransferase [Candidatus Aminicenantes bacterium]|nr:glycosyltransferase [Candidatus Aminicenantes bacterium]
MIRKKNRIAIVHPHLKPGGGSEARALWIVEALKEEEQVNLISMGRIDLGALNDYYGTDLKYDEIGIIEIPIPQMLKKRFDALRSYRLSKYCKKNSDKFDLMISSYNVMDFGKKGIQYIADFSFDDDLRRKHHSVSGTFPRLVYKRSFIRTMYLKLGEWISKGTKEGWRRNTTIANSKWSAEVLQEAYGINAQVIYPPVEEKFPDIPWEEKSNGFVAVGRLVPEKRFDQIIHILKKVREQGHDVHLHIIGGGPYTSFNKTLKRVVEENSSWCFLEGPKYGAEKKKMISKHKFGISGCKNEAFGIAVAEMIKAGNIVWVPFSGGQVEIVDHKELIYIDQEDAVLKIKKTLNDNKKQAEIREHLKKNSEKFSIEIFKIKTRATVEEFIGQSS